MCLNLHKMQKQDYFWAKIYFQISIGFKIVFLMFYIMWTSSFPSKTFISWNAAYARLHFFKIACTIKYFSTIHVIKGGKHSFNIKQCGIQFNNSVTM